MGRRGIHATILFMDEARSGHLGEDARQRADQAFEELGEVVRSAIVLLRDAGLLPPPIPKDPRERALYLRKHRNTGPDRQGALDGRRRR